MDPVAAATGRIPPSWDDDAWASDDWVGTPTPVNEPILVGLAGVEAEPVTWLWEQRIPLASLVVLDGDPGTGKSTITLDLAARISTGRRMPDGSRGIQGNTILVSAEDSLARPIKMRLEAAEADLECVYGLEGVSDDRHPTGRMLVLPEDNAVLHRAILNTDAKLVIIDPIMAYLSSAINSNNDQEIRRAVTPLARTASETGATILIVRHRRKPDTKSKGQTPSLHEGGGSIGIVGAARAGLMVIRDDDDPTISTLFQTKSNYGPWPRPIDYSHVGDRGVGRILWRP